MGSDTFEVLKKIRSLSQHIAEQHAIYKDVHYRLDKCIDNPDHSLKECNELFDKLVTITKDIHNTSADLLLAVEEYHKLLNIRNKRY